MKAKTQTSANRVTPVAAAKAVRAARSEMLGLSVLLENYDAMVRATEPELSRSRREELATSWCEVYDEFARAARRYARLVNTARVPSPKPH